MWKERIEKIIYDATYNCSFDETYVVNNISQLVKEVHEKACEEQRKLDAENAYYYDINGNKVSCKEEVEETPNAKFEE